MTATITAEMTAAKTSETTAKLGSIRPNQEKHSLNQAK